MMTITINGTEVQVSASVYARIDKIAQEKKISFAEAISFCLEKVI
jgi:hypothetical protein